jgi:bacteriocin-like protein
MASMKNSDLCHSGFDLFVDSESFLDKSESNLEELSESELATINGGVRPLIREAQLAYTAYKAYQSLKKLLY